MILFIKLAIRNVRRNIKSTLLNGIGIALSVIILLVIFSLSRGIETGIVSRNIKFESGALSIAFDKETASKQNKSTGDSILTKITTLLSENADIESYSYRIYPSNIVIYFNDNSQRINITGIEDKDIPLLKDMYTLLDGKSDLASEKNTVLISNGLSELLNIKTGDYCNIMLQSVDGTININDFTIGGIFRYTSHHNKNTVYMNYEELKSLYNSNLPSRILINIEDLDKTDSIKSYLAKGLGCDSITLKKEIECNGLKISSYKDHMGMAKSLSKINQYGMLSLAVFLILISFVGIWSMQVENIDGRQKETGSLLSFGFSVSSIKKIFLYESLYISILSFLCGSLIVLLFTSIINSSDGIYMGDSASFAFGSAIINPILTINDLVTTFFITLLYPLISTIISLRAINKNNIVCMLRSGK